MSQSPYTVSSFMPDSSTSISATVDGAAPGSLAAVGPSTATAATPGSDAPNASTSNADPFGLAAEAGLSLLWHETAWVIDAPLTPRTDFTPPDPVLLADRAGATVREGAIDKFHSFRYLCGDALDGVPTAPLAQWWLDFFREPHVVERKNSSPYVLKRDAPEYLRWLLEVAAKTTQVRTVVERMDRYVWGPDRLLGLLALRHVWPLVPENERSQIREFLAQNYPETDKRFPWAWPVAAFLAGGFETEIAGVLDELERTAGDSEVGGLCVDVLPVACLLPPTPHERVRLAEALDAHVARSPQMIIAWLANTGLAGIPLFAKCFARYETGGPYLALRILEERLSGTGAATVYGHLLGGPHKAVAEKWLRSHPEDLAGTDLPKKLTAALVGALRGTDRATLEHLREAATGGAQAAAVQLLEELDIPVFDPATPWWAKAKEQADWRKFRDRWPKYVTIHSFPPFTWDGVRLAEPEMQTFLDVFLTGKGGSGLIAAVRENVPAATRDEFAVTLLNLWINHGCSGNDIWVMRAAATVGHDAFVSRLAPLIRKWPGSGGIQRAKAGLNALEACGSSLALQEIAGMATSSKYPGLKKAARATLEAIAARRGYTREQLEDLMIPSAGLSERGTRTFSYGAREFLASVTSAGTVQARVMGADGLPTGRALTTLPKPLVADDAALAATAKKEFTQFKKNVNAVVKIQAARFEQAMINEREWDAAEFARLFGTHPLMRNLLAGVVLDVRSADGARVSLARLDADGMLVDADDDEVPHEPGASFDSAVDQHSAIRNAHAEVLSHRVRVAHPVHLSETDVRSWAQLLADYELSPPFPQLTRPVHRLGDSADAAPAGAVEFPQILDHPVESGRLQGILADAGWIRGPFQDTDGCTFHVRHYPNADLTVVVHYTPGIAPPPAPKKFPSRSRACTRCKGSWTRTSAQT